MNHKLTLPVVFLGAVCALASCKSSSRRASSGGGDAAKSYHALGK